MPSAALTARNEDIVQRVMRGEGITSIAEDYDISNRTVWKVFRTTTGQTIKQARGYRMSGGWRTDVTTEQVRALRAQGHSIAAIAKELDAAWATIWSRLEEDADENGA